MLKNAAARSWLSASIGRASTPARINLFIVLLSSDRLGPRSLPPWEFFFKLEQ
jgi:hypothetical protein